MNIEVVGVGFNNKGAELMLCAIAQHFRESAADVSLAVAPRVGNCRRIGRYGLFQKAESRCTDPVGLAFDKFTPKRLRQRYGFLRSDEIDAVLDASGYAYGDPWGTNGARRTARAYRKSKRQNKKTVLMPQAFGPFTNSQLRSNFRTILEHVNLLFARDRISYDFIAQIGGPMAHVRVAPDFTNLVDGVLPPYYDTSRPSACIIPNKRMLDKTPECVRDQYPDFLTRCYRYLEEVGLHPFFLLHETNDHEVCSLVEKRLGSGVPTVREDDPVFIKGILGACFLVVGSRYHGLVSALSQGVPCLATGWSDKYRTLFEEYRCAELVCTSLQACDETENKLRAMIEEPSRSRLVETLRQRAAEQKDASRQMWAQVHDVLMC